MCTCGGTLECVSEEVREREKVCVCVCVCVWERGSGVSERERESERGVCGGGALGIEGVHEWGGQCIMK